MFRPVLGLFFILSPLYLLFFFHCHAQISPADSLISLLRNSQHDSEKITLYMQVSEVYAGDNPGKAIEFSEQALALAIKPGNTALLADAYKNIARNQLSCGHYDISLLHCQNAVNLMMKSGDSSSAVSVILLKSTCLMKLGKYKESLETILEFLPYAERTGNPASLSDVYSAIGNVYNYMNRNSESFSYYRQAMEIMEKNNIISHEYVTTLNNSAVIFYGNFQMDPSNKSLIDSSLKYSNKALKVAREIRFEYGISNALVNIGMTYESIEEYQMALKYYLESMEMIKKIGNNEGVAFGYNNLGYVYENLGNYEKALENFQAGLKMAHEFSFPNIEKDSYFGMSETYVKMGDYQKAHEQYLLYSQVKDSLFNIESNNQITEMQARYENEKKEKQLEIQSLELSKKDTEVRKQRLMIWSVVIGLLLVVLFAFFIYTRLRIIGKQKHIIEKQKSLVDDKNKHLESAKKIIEEKNKDIVDSIRYAKRIQEAILPSSGYLQNHLREHFVLFKPKDIVSGDFYWVYQTSGSKIIWAAVDCTGHGVPGAFMSMIGNSLLNEIVVENGIHETDVILNKLRDGIIKALGQTGEAGTQKDGMDMVLCAMDRSNFLLDFSGANNPLWIVRENGLNKISEEERISEEAKGSNSGNGSNEPEFIEINADKQPIGFLTKELMPFTKRTTRLQKGDIIYSFTDGYADQFGGPKGKKFKYSQFKKILLSMSGKTMNEQKDILNETIDKWKGSFEQVDDICVIGVKI